MARLILRYPVAHFYVNQAFGANAAYYAKFLDANGVPEKGHMGLDLMAVHGEPVLGAIDGTAFYVKDSHGGEGVYIRTNQAYDYAGGTAYFNIINWHMVGDTDAKFPPPIPMGGIDFSTKIKAGQLIGYADNTGAPFESSADHLHLGLMPCDVTGKALFPGNGFGGCIDPMPYLVSPDSLINAQVTDALVKNFSAVDVAKYLVEFFKRLIK